jgi:hypothetical protein
VFLSLVFACALQAAVTERAADLAEKFAQDALRETYGIGAMTLSVRTEQYTAGAEPERFWITVSSQVATCNGSRAEEIGEIYVQFISNHLESVQWLPNRDPEVRAAETTRVRMLQWARKLWSLDAQLSERRVPSTTPTEHLVFSRRDARGTITVIIDREYGFVHRTYVSPE